MWKRFANSFGNGYRYHGDLFQVCFQDYEEFESEFVNGNIHIYDSNLIEYEAENVNDAVDIIKDLYKLDRIKFGNQFPFVLSNEANFEDAWEKGVQYLHYGCMAGFQGGLIA